MDWPWCEIVATSSCSARRSLLLLPAIIVKGRKIKCSGKL